MWVICRLSVFCEPFTDRASFFCMYFLHVFFQILILGAVSIFLLSHIYKYAVIISCVSQSCFSMYFSNFNLRSRYYIFLQYSSGPEED